MLTSSSKLNDSCATGPDMERKEDTIETLGSDKLQHTSFSSPPVKLTVLENDIWTPGSADFKIQTVRYEGYESLNIWGCVSPYIQQFEFRDLQTPKSKYQDSCSI